jgi:sulfatase maturation enzyme AslB (radical SAM superfamily)
MINQRLFDHYGIDTTKDLGIQTICSKPFDTVLIDKTGSCYACECTAWLPQSIGNLQLQSLEQILNSDMRQHLQESVSDGRYRYCNEHQCPYVKDMRPYRKTTNDIEHIRLGIDDSCNLRCPSCRKGMIFHKEGSAFKLGIRLADRINEWLYNYSNPIKVHIGSDGDPFASHVYRHFMKHTPVRENIKYSLLTNGLMLRDFHASIPHVINNMAELGVSIDGASSDTYEKLRLGGKWDKIMDALDFISVLKQEHNFQFSLHMVVQQENWHEMESMLDLAHRHNADRVYFNKIEDWNTDIDFDSQTFMGSEEFKESIYRVSTDPIAWNNVATLT